jgi:hypothetical protein
MTEKQNEKVIDVLEDIAHAMNFPETGEVYGQTIATSLEQIAGVMYEIKEQLKRIADKD